MKKQILLAATLVAFVTAGCGKKDDTSAVSSTTTTTPNTASATSAAAPATSGPRTVEITANDAMKYSLNTIEAKPGEKITVVLTNVGSQPKEVMGHNWILLKAGTDVEAFDKAASQAKESDYFPASMSGQVIAHIPLLGPRKSGEITFEAPTAPGEYPFLCSFPAHYQVGMKGVLVVK